MKNKLIKFSLLTVFTVIFLFSFSGCTACARQQWQQVYDSYTNDKYKDKFVYQSFNVTIENFDQFINYKDRVFSALISEEDYLALYGQEAPAEVYRRDEYYFVAESIAILNETGFYDDINENTIITFTVNDYIGWDGWRYPVFAVAIDGKTYLDFDTGKENVLNYVQEKIKNPKSN